jgi:hypothetical protein
MNRTHSAKSVGEFRSPAERHSPVRALQVEAYLAALAAPVDAGPSAPREATVSWGRVAGTRERKAGETHDTT